LSQRKLVSKRTFNWHWHYASNKKIVVWVCGGLWVLYCLGLVGSGAYYVGGLVLLVRAACVVCGLDGGQ
jgi:hypothetical protein